LGGLLIWHGLIVSADHQHNKSYVKYEKEELTIDKIVDAINKSGYKASKL